MPTAGVLGQGIATVDALRALSPEHRQALADTWLHGRGVVEAAGATGDSAPDLTRRLHEALRALASARSGRRDWPAGVHVGVGAYLLRLLDAESERCFAEHLSSCGACRDEVVGLGPVVTALERARFDRDGAGRRVARAMAPGAHVTPPVGFPRPAAATPAPGATRHAARAEREARGSRPRLLLPLAATAALLAAGGVASADDLGLVPAPVVVPQAGASSRAAAAPSASSASSASSAREVRRAAANGPGTGVAAEVEVSPAGPGVQEARVSLSLTGLSGPRSCRLVAVRQDGATQVLATWQVPPAGFGTTRQPDPFALSVVTAAAVGDLVAFRVESGDAAGTVLVTVPM